MDANGTRFHLLLGRGDWAQCLVETHFGRKSLEELWKLLPSQWGSGLAWNDEVNELTLEPRLFKFTAAPKDTRPLIENRRGAGRDRFGNWYWIDETSLKIRVLSIGSGETADFWPLPQSCLCPQAGSLGDFAPRDEEQDSAPLKLMGLAVTEDHYLVVGVSQPAGLLIFDLHTGAEPRQLLWPTGIRFEPFDMAPRPGGGVWVLDRSNHCYWALNRHFNVIGPEGEETLLAEAQPDDFQPVEKSEPHGTPRRQFPKDFSLLKSPLSLNDPIAIEALPDGTVLLLDYDPAQRFSSIYRFRLGQQLPDQISTETILKLIENKQQSGFSLVGYDMAFVPEHVENGAKVTDRLYIVAADGNQSYAFRLCLRDGTVELQPIAEYLPMRLFGGKGLVGTQTAAHYDFAENWIPLVKQRRPRFVPDATCVTPVFDGGQPDCVWHRLMVDGCIPPDTKVEIWSRAANEEHELELLPWQIEPRPYLRGDGSELPFLRSATPANPVGSERGRLSDGTWELLFQRARGRYLQLQLRLSGDERSTPHLRALRAYYPRFSYLENYLPGVYREDQSSASFLDRFLSNVEGLYTTLEDKIAAIQVLFDVRSAPSEILDWLAGWFGVALDPSWDEARRRMFIAHAMDFFQYRGTIRGLTMALHLALDESADESIFDEACAQERNESIRFVEKYLTRTLPGVLFGDPTELIGLRTVNVAASWQPEQGRANLSQRYSTFINGSDEAGAAEIQYPLVGFVPSADAERLGWQTFLVRLYGNIASLNAAHKTNHASFSQIALPGDLPAVAAAQHDWQNFELEKQSATTPLERRLWHNFLSLRYGDINSLNQVFGTQWTGFDIVAIPDALPRDSAQVEDWGEFLATEIERWRQFSLTTLGFVPLPAAPERAAWQGFLQGHYANIVSLNTAHHTNYPAFKDISLPSDLPTIAAALKDWQDFTGEINPAATSASRHLWQDFLARRYHRIKALNKIYGTSWTSFELVSLPDELPIDGAPLADWFQFETVVLRMQRTAHQFTVLLPVPMSQAFSVDEHQRRLDLSRRIIDLEKPAHTVFDVKFYWAMFRVGGARLQLDTVLAQGSRAPQLLPGFVLGQGFVGESYLAPPVPENASDRFLLGRDPLARTPS